MGSLASVTVPGYEAQVGILSTLDSGRRVQKAS